MDAHRLIAAIALVFAGCQGASPEPSALTTVQARALAGPTCPTVTDPPDPSCADRPVAGAGLQVLDADGVIIEELIADEEGRFTLRLAPGNYRLVPQPVDGLMGTAGHVDIVVGSQPPADEVVLAYDTGIR